MSAKEMRRAYNEDEAKDDSGPLAPLSPGSRVQTVGLQKAPALNGISGTVQARASRRARERDGSRLISADPQ